MTTALRIAPAELRRQLEENLSPILLAGLGAWIQQDEGEPLSFDILVRRAREALDTEELRMVLHAAEDRARALRALLPQEQDQPRTPEQILKEAQAAIWELPMLTSTEAGRQLGSTASNPRELPRRLREESSLLGLPGRSGYCYPKFQIDPEKQRIHPEAAEVNRRLDAADDPWGVASWWISPDDRLGGRRPLDLLGTAEAVKLVRLVDGMLAPIG